LADAEVVVSNPGMKTIPYLLHNTKRRAIFNIGSCVTNGLKLTVYYPAEFVDLLSTFMRTLFKAYSVHSGKGPI
jgi:hypothetical protein